MWRVRLEATPKELRVSVSLLSPTVCAMGLHLVEETSQPCLPAYVPGRASKARTESEPASDARGMIVEERFQLVRVVVVAAASSEILSTDYLQPYKVPIRR